METMTVDLVEQARQLRLQAEALEKNARLARGTQRVEHAPFNPALRQPRGRYWVGNEGTTDDLTDTVRSMITERPLFFRQIVEETGAGENRVKGVITRIQREGSCVVDVAPEGTGKALWFIPSPEVLARIMRARRAAAKNR